MGSPMPPSKLGIDIASVILTHACSRNSHPFNVICGELTVHLRCLTPLSDAVLRGVFLRNTSHKYPRMQKPPGS